MKLVQTHVMFVDDEDTITFLEGNCDCEILLKEQQRKQHAEEQRIKQRLKDGAVSLGVSRSLV